MTLYISYLCSVPYVVIIINRGNVNALIISVDIKCLSKHKVRTHSLLANITYCIIQR